MEVDNLSKYFIVMLLFVSCNTKSDVHQQCSAKKPSTPIDDKRRIYALIDSALMLGNGMAYNEVSSYYLIEDMGESFFYYAFTMANKYNNAEACFHVYSIIANSTSKQPKEALGLKDKKTKNLALYYLIKSHEMGYESAKIQLVEIFGEDEAPQKSSYYLKQACEE